MRERRIVGIAVLLSVLLSVSLAFGLGLVDVSKLPFVNTSPPAGGGPGPTVFMDPVKIIDETKQAGSFVSFHVDISDVTDLYTWQLNVSWNPSILTVSDINAGEFLLRTGSTDKTAAYQLGYVVNATDYANGYACISESILGEVAGETGSGRLVSIEFEVVGYGCTDLNISISGDLPTTLLNSAGSGMTYTETGGYFRNKRTGDANADTDVNVFDILKVKHHWYPGPPVGAGGYERNVDINDDGSINVFDILIVKANWD